MLSSEHPCRPSCFFNVSLSVRPVTPSISGPEPMRDADSNHGHIGGDLRQWASRAKSTCKFRASTFYPCLLSRVRRLITRGRMLTHAVTIRCPDELPILGITTTRDFYRHSIRTGGYIVYHSSRRPSHSLYHRQRQHAPSP